MFKVGDIVEATTNKYGFTSKRNNWVGRVVRVDPYSNTFNGRTIDCISPADGIGDEFTSLRIEDFALCPLEVDETEFTILVFGS